MHRSSCTYEKLIRTYMGAENFNMHEKQPPHIYLWIYHDLPKYSKKLSSGEIFETITVAIWVLQTARFLLYYISLKILVLFKLLFLFSRHFFFLFAKESVSFLAAISPLNWYKSMDYHSLQNLYLYYATWCLQ